MKMTFKKHMILLVVLFLSLTAVSCKMGEKKAEVDNRTKVAVEKAGSLDLELEEYDGDYFTVRMPKGWTIKTVGTYENFGFRMYDKANPERQIFFYGNMNPLMKSTGARNFWKSYIAGSGFPDAKLYVDAPILSKPTAAQFFSIFNQYTSFARNYGIKHDFPSLEVFNVLDTSERETPISSVAKDDSIVRAVFTQNGIPCQGLFGAAVVDAMKYPVGNVDAGYYTVYVIAGIAAPIDEFFGLEEQLSKSIASFKFKDSYIKEGVAQNEWETKSALEMGRTLSEAYDSYNQAWRERQKPNDAAAQKYGDSNLGYDRLYDKDTGKTYRAELGFWDEYKNNPEEYNMNLEKVPDNGYDLYNKPVSGYISK